MGRLGGLIAWLRFSGPTTETVMRDSQGNEMDPAELEGDEPEELVDLEIQQKQRRRWAWMARRMRWGRFWWPR